MFVPSCVAKTLSSTCSNSGGLVPNNTRRPGACQTNQRKRRFTVTEMAQLQPKDTYPNKRLALSLAPSTGSASSRIALTFCSLPTELIVIIAQLLCDTDLHSLTRVSGHLRAIGCPQYLCRKGLTSTASGQSFSVCTGGFEALGMWRRSPGFSAQQMLFCHFDLDPNRVALEIHWLNKFFISLPLQSTMFFRCVCLFNMETPTLRHSLDLLKIAADTTRCHALEITGISFLDARWWKKGKPQNCVVLEYLEKLEFRDCRLSGSQWMNLLSKLRIPSLREFTVIGETSMAAVYYFLRQHPGVHIIDFRRCTTKDVLLSSGRLRLPLLWSLKGSLSQILDLLRSLPSQPTLGKLVVESNLPVTSRQDTLLNQILHCLTLCKGYIALEICLSKTASMAELMRADVCAPVGLRGCALPCTISTLCIQYEGVCDESILAYCGAWMPFQPSLRRVNLAKVEPNDGVWGFRILWGRVELTEDGLCELIWGTKAR